MPQTKKLYILILGAAITLLVCPFLGMEFISPLALFSPASPELEILLRLRLPRVLGAFLAGAALATSGVVFQAIFRNPLATPFTLGVSSGASLGASCWLLFGTTISLAGSLGSLGCSFAGAGLSMLFVYGITRARGGFSTPVMLLAGVVISFFFSSLVLLIQYLARSGDSLRIMHWLMGSFASMENARVADLAFIVITGVLFLHKYNAELDLLTTGEDFAASRGVNINAAKLKFFAISSIMAGTVVSLAGPIGFVGMMIPHICRLIFGWGHRALLPASFFMGGAFLSLCDLASRTILAPAELPIGIITALTGGPFFLYTLFRLNKDGDFF